jgi:hypothetical protein
MMGLINYVVHAIQVYCSEFKITQSTLSLNRIKFPKKRNKKKEFKVKHEDLKVFDG